MAETPSESIVTVTVERIEMSATAEAVCE